MTPVSIGLNILGLVTLFWPLATLLFKRRVLNAQWLMMLAMSMLAFTFFLLGGLFSTFLMGEYILMILFFVIILVTPPVIHIALTVLTQPQARPLSIRAFFLPSIICIALMILSVIIGGADMYRLWAARGLEGLTWMFFPNSWRYNLIVFVNFYLFWGVFIFEALFILITSIRQFVHFKRINAEYYTSDRFQNLNLKGIYIAANMGILILSMGQFTRVFEPRYIFWFYFTYCLPLAILLFYIGRSVYMINNGAERLPTRSRSRKDSSYLIRQLEEYVEKEQAFLNPDLSVFMLAEHLHTSEDDVIDTIYRYHGIPFGDYIDALRVQHAVSLMLAEHPDIENPDTLAHLAHRSGFLTVDALEDAWYRNFRAPISQSHILN